MDQERDPIPAVGLALVGAFLGAKMGYYFLEIRYIASGYEYVSPRHYDVGGRWLWFVEGMAAGVCGALLLFRVGWLVGRRRWPSKWEWWFVIPLALLGYLTYVSNVG